MRIIVPVGHTHSLHPGSAHFLEHVVGERSLLYPKHEQFEQFIGLHGGSFTATIGQHSTKFRVEIERARMMKSWKGLLSQVFEPVFDENDFPYHTKVILSERSDFCTGEEHPMSSYLWNRWMRLGQCSMRQIFGDREDLEAIDIPLLRSLHNHYFSDKTIVLIGGDADIDYVYSTLESLPIHQTSLSQQSEEKVWVQKRYHEKPFPNLERYHLHAGSVFSGSLDCKTLTAIDFIFEYLTNEVHGPLYTWARREFGTYTVERRFLHDRKKFGWYIHFKLKNHNDAIKIKEGLHEKIKASLLDASLVRNEVKRRIKNLAFKYHTLDSVLTSAQHSLERHGHVCTESEYRAHLEVCAPSEYLLEIYDRYFSPRKTGIMCGYPQ